MATRLPPKLLAPALPKAKAAGIDRWLRSTVQVTNITARVKALAEAARAGGLKFPKRLLGWHALGTKTERAG